MELSSPVIVIPVFSGLVMLWPAMRIAARAGLSRLLGLTILIPYFGVLIFMAALAHQKWPVLPEKEKPIPKQRGEKRSMQDLLQISKQNEGGV